MMAMERLRQLAETAVAGMGALMVVVAADIGASERENSLAMNLARL